MALDPSVPAEQELLPDPTYQLHLDADTIEPGLPASTPPAADPLQGIPAQEILTPVDQHAVPGLEHGQVPPPGHGHHPPANGDGQHTPANGDGQHTPANGDGHHTPANGDGHHTPANGDGHHTPAHGDGHRGKPTGHKPTGHKPGKHFSGGGDFEVNLAELNEAAESVAKNAKNIRGFTNDITARLLDVERTWATPAGWTFAELQRAVTEDMNALNDVLDEMVKKMRLAYHNYSLMEKTNLKNLR